MKFLIRKKKKRDPEGHCTDLILLQAQETCPRIKFTLNAHVSLIFDCTENTFCNSSSLSNRRVILLLCWNCRNTEGEVVCSSYSPLPHWSTGWVSHVFKDLTVVGTFPFSDFHETTEQTKMAALIQHHGRWCQNGPESCLVSRKKWPIWLTPRWESSL